LKFQRQQFRPRDGAFGLDVAIGPADRFLTLVSTDGGNGPLCDWVVLGDPVLQMTSTKSEEPTSESEVRETRQDRGGASHTRSTENRKGEPLKK
jgi:hypothetical protein